MAMQIRWLIPIGAGAASIAHVACATQYMTVKQAQSAAFPNAAAFVAATPLLDAAIRKAIDAPAGWMPQVWQARKGDAVLGWLMVDRVIGKSELVTYALAVNATGAVIALDVLDYRESHGGEIRLSAWRRQFDGKTAADPVKLNHDIKNISGATLSCRHVTEGVRRLLQLYDHALREG
ncbi:MAG: FMN-binding protein [Rudaea sp.]